MGQIEIFASAAVAAPHKAAAETGQTILAMGGNAVEAMVAMAGTIAVAYPHMNSIGGDGFWLVREPKGRVLAFEGCGASAALATRAFYTKPGHDVIPARGPLAALTVPGAISGWQLALDYARAIGGKLPLSDLLRDAIRHAREGLPVSPSQTRHQPKIDAPGFAQTFLNTKGEWRAQGELQRFEKLADTLDHLAHQGLRDFYEGDVAREMAHDLEQIGSPLRRDDFKRHEARVREALSLKLKGRTHYNFPPPTQGLASLLILGMFERLNVTRCDSADHIHALVEATKRAFALRDQLCTDPAFATRQAEDVLTDRVMESEAAVIDMARAANHPLPSAKGDTIWMGAIDAQGTAVSYIQSIYWEYGSGCVLPRTGVLMQNRGTSFSLDPRAVNRLEPRRKPFHTLNPALCAFDDGRVMPYGTMGGDGQPQVQAQLFTRYNFGMDLAEAINTPRFIYGRLWGENSTHLALEEGFDPSVIRELSKRGHEIVERARGDSFGHAGALLRNEKGYVAATHDPRADGGAMGL
jgi:gamma-glutamyltranspeptidase/glutathione hydrolase